MNIPHSRTGQYTSSLAGVDMHASGRLCATWLPREGQAQLW